MLALNDKFIQSLSNTLGTIAPDYVVKVVEDYRRLLPQLRLVYTLFLQK